MNIAATGFVADAGGSVASANGLLLKGLLSHGVAIDFFSKPSFVDPRRAVGQHEGFRFLPVVNHRSDSLRRKCGAIPILGLLAERNDCARYNKLLIERMRAECRGRQYCTTLWLGDYAHGRVPGTQTVSFAQGPPGTDAQSILRRRHEVRQIAGRATSWKWEILARARLSRWGLPELRYSDHIIVGSRESCRTLLQRFKVPEERVSILPYPIDMELFKPLEQTDRIGFNIEPLRVLWLGRVVPRKRLDLFLDGAALAINRGFNVELTVIGRIGFLKGYEKLISGFQFPQRLRWIESVPRDHVPEVLRGHDVLAQPSEEENFGSSVAEAQACGIPVIVGHTNGNADYLCAQDVHLADDRPESLAAALEEMAARKCAGHFGDPLESRKCAERCFNLNSIVERMVATLQNVNKRRFDDECDHAKR